MLLNLAFSTEWYRINAVRAVFFYFPSYIFPSYSNFPSYSFPYYSNFPSYGFPYYSNSLPSWKVGAEASDKIAGLAGFEEKAVWAYITRKF